MKRSLTRLVLSIAVLQVLYLAAANLALNLPQTQTLINQHRPDQYQVRWESAWTWLPLRVHARGISANGQTSGQQWQADCTEATASLSVLPFFQRTVHIHDVDMQDVVFRLRPRPKPDKDYAAIRAFFPPIDGREPNLPAAQPKTKKPGKPWRIIVDDAVARGSHQAWIFQVRADLDGELRADIGFETRGGPLSVAEGNADLTLSSLVLNRDWEVSKDGTLAGSFSVAPFSPSEHKGLKALGFLSADLQIDAPVDSLDFLDFYLRRLNGIELNGRGRWSGRLAYHQGSLVSGSELTVAADELALDAAPYRVTGAGDIGIAVHPEAPDALEIGIGFDALEAFHQENEAPLFVGERLRVDAQGPTGILQVEPEQMRLARMSVTIPTVSVPDLRAFQRYLPDNWGVQVKGGQGQLKGQAELSATSMSTELSLQSSNADIAFKDYRFNTNLDLGLKSRAGADETASLDLSGSYLRLDQAKVIGGKAASATWQAAIEVRQGTMTLDIPDGDGDRQGFVSLSDALREQDLKTLLTSADARLDASLSLSDLRWINLLFKDPFRFAVSGSGEVAADLRIDSGWLAKGTNLKVQPRGLEVQVLDYVAGGAGLVAMTVERGGQRPDLRLEAELGDASLKRRGEDKAVVEQVEIGISALATQVAFGEAGSIEAIDLRIPSARVTDMTVYNNYIPSGAPLRLLGGEADLTADVHLKPNTADGMVHLQTQGLKARLDDQDIAGELVLDILLKDGVPQDMDFDISGSSLRLNKIKVAGEHASFDQQDWRARFDLSKARVVWSKPVKLDVQAEIQMQDSRPIVALFANQRGKHGWLEKMITVEDVRGKAELQVDTDRIVIPHAFAGSDKIDVGAKGLIDGEHREGVFFARFRALKGILKIQDGERNFDILRARAKFDDYVPGKTALGPGSTAPDEPETSDQNPTQDASAADQPQDEEGTKGGDKEGFMDKLKGKLKLDKGDDKKSESQKEEEPFSILDDLD